MKTQREAKGKVKMRKWSPREALALQWPVGLDWTIFSPTTEVGRAIAKFHCALIFTQATLLSV